MNRAEPHLSQPNAQDPRVLGVADARGTDRPADVPGTRAASFGRRGAGGLA